MPVAFCTYDRLHVTNHRRAVQMGNWLAPSPSVLCDLNSEGAWFGNTEKIMVVLKSVPLRLQCGRCQLCPLLLGD